MPVPAWRTLIHGVAGPRRARASRSWRPRSRFCAAPASPCNARRWARPRHRCGSAALGELHARLANERDPEAGDPVRPGWVRGTHGVTREGRAGRCLPSIPLPPRLRRGLWRALRPRPAAMTRHKGEGLVRRRPKARVRGDDRGRGAGAATRPPEEHRGNFEEGRPGLRYVRACSMLTDDSCSEERPGSKRLNQRSV